ncbi:glutathione S-transferase N-terminal domain-containing protein [Peptoniphilus sp. EMRHCC_23]|uniref:glutaredoxin family protein n=1 Tax=Peptoniphilus TaxID=162289 RepID=UPI001C00433B|nr:glutathione S-transferase N-terminal domain-containing protein [Peptoniphilus rachelemmaiella]
MDYKLYAATYCPFCKKVIDFMEKEGVEKVDVVFVDKDDEAKKALLEGSGGKQVPCLHYGDTWMLESDDIIAYMKENLI